MADRMDQVHRVKRRGRHQDGGGTGGDLTRRVKEARAAESRRRRTVLTGIVRGPAPAAADHAFALKHAHGVVARLPMFALQGVVFLAFALGSMHALLPLSGVNIVLLTLFALCLLIYLGCAIWAIRLWVWLRRQPQDEEDGGE